MTLRILGEVLVPAVRAPILAGAVATVATFTIYRAIRSRPAEATQRGFRLGQIASASPVALAHGTNLSTTHVTSGGVMGTGLEKRAADVRWGVAGQMVTAWLVTLPAAAVMAGAFYLVSEALGVDLAGPLVVGAVAATTGVVLVEGDGTHRAAPAARAAGGLALLVCLALLAFGLSVLFDK